ncbi:hypothetical protein GCM10020000_39350 [Streptomyces olivoverticillatus]
MRRASASAIGRWSHTSCAAKSARLFGDPACGMAPDAPAAWLSHAVLAEREECVQRDLPEGQARRYPRQRALPSGQRHDHREDRQEPRAQRPRRHTRAGRQRMPARGQQNTDRGEHRGPYQSQIRAGAQDGVRHGCVIIPPDPRLPCGRGGAICQLP